MLWDELEGEESDEATAGESGEQSETSIDRGGVDETLGLDVEDETSLEAAARLWALSEWMVQPNSTYHDAHSGLFSVYEEPEEEVFEKVFGYQVATPPNPGEGDNDGESNSAAFGEAAGEWQEAQFDPTAAQRAAAEAAAARKAVGRGGPSSRRRDKQLPADDGVELAELSPAAGGTPRRAAVVHTPVIEPIDPFARRTAASLEASATSSTKVASAPVTSTGRAVSNGSVSDDDQGFGQSEFVLSESASVTRNEAPAEMQMETDAQMQRMAWSALSDEERAAAIVLGWESDGVGWEQGERPGERIQTADQPAAESDGTTAVQSSPREWRKLSPTEQAAGSVLGFDHISWDEEMVPEVAAAKAKAKAAADEAVELAMLARAAKEDAELARESRRAEAAKKEEARAARKAKVAAAKAQRKALKDAEEKEQLASDAARKVREQQEAEKSRLNARNASRATTGGRSGGASPEKGTSEAQQVDVDQADAEVEQQQQLQEKDTRNEHAAKEQASSPGARATEPAEAGVQTKRSDPASPEDVAAAEAAFEAQAKAAFAALAAAAAEGAGLKAGGDLTSSGTPVRTPGRSATAGAFETTPPADEKKQAVVAAKADYFFGQAMKLHDEFAAIERRTGARKLS